MMDCCSDFTSSITLLPEGSSGSGITVEYFTKLSLEKVMFPIEQNIVSKKFELF